MFPTLHVQIRFQHCLHTGENLVIGDTLSRAPLTALNQHDKHLEEDVEAYVDVIFQDLSVIKRRLKEILRSQVNDPLRQEVAQNTAEKLGQGKDELKIRLNVIIQYHQKYQL